MNGLGNKKEAPKMGLSVIIDLTKSRVVHIGESLATGLRVTPQWLAKARQANPSTYREYNTDHYTGNDEAVIALLWIVEDLKEELRSIQHVLTRMEESMLPRETMGGESP